MSAIDIAVLIAAAVIVFALVCRVDAMHVRTHDPAQLGLHIALGIAAVAAGVHAWERATDLQDACALIAAACWIGSSASAWRKSAES